MSATSSASASSVYIAVALGAIVPAAWYVLARMRGRPQATLREPVWGWATAVPFMLCASLAVTYHRWRWLLWVAIGISLASIAWQFIGFQRERNRARGR